MFTKRFVVLSEVELPMSDYVNYTRFTRDMLDELARSYAIPPHLLRCGKTEVKELPDRSYEVTHHFTVEPSKAN